MDEGEAAWQQKTKKRNYSSPEKGYLAIPTTIC